MNEPENFVANLPGFKEAIARIARVPANSQGDQLADEFFYVVRDESHKIAYKIISARRLTPADVRRSLIRAFTRTAVWPNAAGEVEIRV